MDSPSTDLSDLFRRALSEYPIDQIGEGLTQHVAREDIERRIPEQIRDILSDDALVVKSSAGRGRWTAIPWIAIMDSRETTQIQHGTYVVYLFEPQEQRVTLTLNQGVTELKNELGTKNARQELTETAQKVRKEIQPSGFSAGSLEFPHASNRNKLYGPGTIFYKRYTLGEIPDDEALRADLRILVDSYREYISGKQEADDPTIYQVPVKDDGPIGTNYQRTVKEGIPKADLEGICPIPVDHETIRVWGNQEDSSAESGDYLLFAEREGRYEGEYTLLARITYATVLDPETASDFTDAVGWGEVSDETFPHVMFLEPIYETTLDREAFWDTLGFKGWPNDTYSSINFDRDGSQFYQEYASVTAFIDHIKGRQVYPGDINGPSPIDEYESTEEAITDVRDRLTQTEPGSDWLLNRLGEYLVREWSGALTGYKPSDEVSTNTAATFDQLRSIYEQLESDLETKAAQLGVGSLEGFPPKKTLFLGWVRVLQENLNVEGAVLSQPRLNSILADSYSVATTSEKPTSTPDHPLPRHIETTDATVYKVTAPPDFWLTTYEYAALGLEPDDHDTWAELKSGDVILFHSRREPGREALEAQDACILGAGIVRSTTTKPDDDIWWYDEQPDRSKADTFPYLVAFDRLYATGEFNAIDLSTEIFDKSVERVNTEIAALTANALSFGDADSISSQFRDEGFPRYHTITPLDDPDTERALAAELAPALQSVPPVAMHKPFRGHLDPDEILDDLYFPDSQGEEIITQLEGAIRAGKHAILTGPPGTGKTEIARRAGEYLAAEYPHLYSGSQVTTATADWSTFDTVGGYMPKEDDTEGDHLDFTPGLVLNRFKTRQSNTQRNEALVIDELNRADIDKAFGQLFTVLSGQPVQLPYTKNGQEVDLAPVDEQSIPAPHEYRIPEAWSLFATLNTYDKTSLYEMSYAFMRRFSFIRVPAPRLADLDETALQDLLTTYTNTWDISFDGSNTPEDVDPLVDVGVVWQAANGAIEDRAIGPAVVKDIVSALIATPSIPWERRLTQAVISYIFPQLEGVPKRNRVVGDLADVDRIDETLLDQASRDMLQVTALQNTDESR